MEKKDLMDKAAKLLGECEVVYLASMSEGGFPRPCAMERVDFEGIAEVWFSTGLGSAKTKHFQTNPKAGIGLHKGGDSLTLLGQVEVSRDPALKARLWKDAFTEHFPGGVEDPDYCVLRFRTQEATIWIDGEFETVKV